MKKIAIGFVLLALAGSTAFAVFGGMSFVDGLGLRGAERQVRARVLAYWDARLRNDLEAMAQYVHPQESMIMQPGALVTEQYELQTLELREDAAVATLKIRSRIKQAGFSTNARETVLKDPWVRFEGTWYKAPGPVTIQDAIRQYRGTYTPPVVAGNTAAPSAE
jgi:hypothetical protein